VNPMLELHSFPACLGGGLLQLRCFSVPHMLLLLIGTQVLVGVIQSVQFPLTEKAHYHPSLFKINQAYVVKLNTKRAKLDR
jgi:hypothetical protein